MYRIHYNPEFSSWSIDEGSHSPERNVNRVVLRGVRAFTTNDPKACIIVYGHLDIIDDIAYFT